MFIHKSKWNRPRLDLHWQWVSQALEPICISDMVANKNKAAFKQAIEEAHIIQAQSFSIK